MKLIVVDKDEKGLTCNIIAGGELSDNKSINVPGVSLNLPYVSREDKKDIEVLLIQDSKNRWTIPKGHIEPGETAKMTARREIEEETGLKNVSILTWLGKIHFKYRRSDKLVLMTTQIYLVQALDDHELPTGEKWMKGIQWFSFADALNAIEYEDIGKLMLIAKKKIRAGEFS